MQILCIALVCAHCPQLRLQPSWTSEKANFPGLSAIADLIADSSHVDDALDSPHSSYMISTPLCGVWAQVVVILFCAEQNMLSRPRFDAHINSQEGAAIGV